MKKLFALSSAICLMFTLGCGSDQRESLVSLTVDKLNSAAGSLSNIKENVIKWDKETKDAEKAKFLKNAIVGTDSLRGVAQTLQRIKQEGSRLEAITKEQREEFQQKYRDRVRAAIDSLNKQQTGLNEALVQAEKNHPRQKSELTELRQKLQLAQSEFEAQTKQQ